MPPPPGRRHPAEPAAARPRSQVHNGRLVPAMPGWALASPHPPSSFTRSSRTKAPSLHRHYPASSVLRASPPPQARPVSRGLPVGTCHATSGASRVASISFLHACRHHSPGGTGRCSRRSLPDPCQPSPNYRRVGFRIISFEACSAFSSARRRRCGSGRSPGSSRREARCAGPRGGGSARSRRTARPPPARRAPACRGSPAPLRPDG